jgi:hypothetical protein
LEQTPVGVREALEEFADLEVMGGHGADAGDQFQTNVFGDGLLVDFGGEVVATLGGVFMEGSLKEVQGGGDLALELFPAEGEELILFAHMYAYLYAYFKASKSSRQEGKFKKVRKKPDFELNCYF